MNEWQWLREQAGEIEVVAKGRAEPAAREYFEMFSGPQGRIVLPKQFLVAEIDLFIRLLTLTREMAEDYEPARTTTNDTIPDAKA